MQLTYGALLTRALMAGAAVGVLLAGYMFFVVEPTIDEAIELEERLADDHTGEAGHAHDEDDALFSRSEQVGGGLAANVIYALVASAIFGTVFAKLRHRLPGGDDFGRALWLAAVGFGTIALMPAVKYPANPPAVGDPDTVGERTVQYLALIAISLLLAWALTRLSGRLRQRFDDVTRAVVVAATTVVAYGLILVVAPGTPDVIAPEVPAGLVWDFRLRSLGGLALLWAGLGLGVGWLVHRETVEQHPADRNLVAA